MQRIALAGLAAMAAVLAPGMAQAQLPPGYEVQIKGRTISIPSSIPGFQFPDQTSITGRDVVLNDSGDLAILVASVPLEGGDTTQAVWLHRDGAGTLVHKGTVTASDAGFRDLALTRAGRLYWTESPFGGTPGIFYLDPGGTPMLLTRQPLGTSSYGSMRVNETGQLAVLAQLATGRVLGVIDVSQPNFQLYLAERSVDSTSPFQFLISGMGFNDGGRMTVEAWPFVSSTASNEAVQRVLGPGATSQLVAKGDMLDSVGTVRAITNGTAMNSAGQVAVIVLGNGSVDAVLRAEPDGTFTTIALTTADSAVADVGNFPPVINEAGLVAFRGVGADGEDAIYVGNGSELRTVVRETDVVPADLGPAQIGNEVPGSAYTAFSGNIAINARGDIAFVASVYPQGDRNVEWGSGVFVAVAQGNAPEPDAGVPGPDAGAADAGPSDAGAADAAPGNDDAGLADASPGLDAAPGRDSGSQPDAGNGGPGGGNDGGCGCVIGAGSGRAASARGALLLLGMLALALGRQRRSCKPRA